MAKENSYLKDIREYRAAVLGDSYAKERNRPYAKASLEQLVSDLGIGEKANFLVEGTVASEQGIATAVSIAKKRYNDALGFASVDELMNLYSESIDKYLSPENAEKFRAKLAKVKNEKYGDITKKLNQAQYVIMGKKEGLYDFKDKEIEDAKKNQETYKEIKGMIDSLSTISVEKLTPEINDRFYRELLKSYVEDKKE